MQERHLGKQKPSFDALGCLGTWVGHLTETLGIKLAPFMVETGPLAGWLPSTPATFRAEFFLRTFTLEKEIRGFQLSWMDFGSRKGQVQGPRIGLLCGWEYMI